MKGGTPMPDQPEICDRCLKPIIKMIIIICWVESELSVPDGGTRATFNILTGGHEHLN